MIPSAATETPLGRVRQAVARRYFGPGASDRGAVLVELALVTPLLFTLLIGIFEFGQAWRERAALHSGVRSAMRIVTNSGADRQADKFALQSFIAIMSQSKALTIQKVVIYKASNADGSPLDSSCLTSNTPSAAYSCNVYTSTQLNNPLLGFNFTGTTDCSPASTAWDYLWCPLSRISTQGDEPDYVGVYVVASYKSSTGLLPSTVTFTDRAVARIDPKVT